MPKQRKKKWWRGKDGKRHIIRPDNINWVDGMPAIFYYVADEMNKVNEEDWSDLIDSCKKIER